jgi:hypothetical protein
MLVNCPNCKQKTTWEENPWRPFCSERCKMIDLGTWASEGYALPCDDSTDDINKELQNEKD